MKKFFLLLLGALTLASGPVVAATKKSSPPPPTPQVINTFGTTVSPPTMEIDGVPGGTIRKTIKVTNGSDADLTYQTSVVDFHVEGIEGSISIDDNDNGPYSASKWIKVAQTSFATQIKHTTEVEFTVTVPANAEPGGHYAAVLFQPKVGGGPTGSGAATIPRVGTLILIRLPGATTEKAAISKLVPKNFVGAWDELVGVDGKTKFFVAKGENLNAEHEKRFFWDNAPIGFNATFSNLGTVHIKPTGTLTITNLFGQKAAELALNPQNVFPGTQRRVTIIWPGKWHWGLFYKAKLNAIYGASNQIMTAETWFIAFPWPVLVAILVLLILMRLMRKRLKRVMRILIKGE